jgi:hypothetical protein
MAEVWGAIAGGIIAGGAAYAGSERASGAAQRGADAATREQARQYDQTRADLRPGRELYQGATAMLGRLYGIPIQNDAQARGSAPMLVGDTELPAGTTFKDLGKGWYEVHYGGQRIGTLRPGGENGRFLNDAGVDISALFAEQGNRQAAAAPTGPDMSVFFESPDYQFNLAEGQKAIDRSLAARGRSLSGAGVKEGIRYASGMASTEYGNFYNRLANLAGLGQSATQATAAAGANAANNISQNHLFAGQSRANGYMTAAAGINNAAQGSMQNYLLARYLQQPGSGGVGYSGGAGVGNWNGPRD